MKNGVMLQGFQWELPPDGGLWRFFAKNAFALRRQGFTAVWLPPAFKGAAGDADVGYGVYDLYDLGEFDQKGSVRTRYGSREQYLSAIRSLQAAGIQALADVVLNHRMGADESEELTADRMDWDDRTRAVEENVPVRLFTRFTFPGRRRCYSDFTWDASCFTASDWDESKSRGGLYRISGKNWARDVDGEKGNFDYLMGADVDFSSPAVLGEMTRWGRWYCDTTGADGFRLDAVKHISAAFYRDWLTEMRRYTGRELFAVGEYWQSDVRALHGYLEKVEESMSLFDVPLHNRFYRIGRGEDVDMARLFEDTLVGTRPHLAVTFTDNHDTQPGQALESWVEAWFKPAAYGLILLRAFGYPCVFWGDLFGVPTRGIPPVREIPLLMKLRRLCAHGEEHDFLDDPCLIGFTREGDGEHPGSGLAFVCTRAGGGGKRMFAGKRNAGRVFRCLNAEHPDVMIDSAGWGVFLVSEGAMSVYAPRMTAREYVLRARGEALRILEDTRLEALHRARSRMRSRISRG